jgi:hypothetical protein
MRRRTLFSALVLIALVVIVLVNRDTKDRDQEPVSVSAVPPSAPVERSEKVGSSSVRALTSDSLKVVAHGRHVTFQIAEIAVPRALFRDILERIDRLQRPTSVTA